MNPKQLIDYLESQPQDRKIRRGFHEPFSYRGNYKDVALVFATTPRLVRC